jgi:hypothetical protein
MKLTDDLLRAIVLAEVNLFQVSNKNSDFCDDDDTTKSEDNDSNEISLNEVRRIAREEIRNFTK